MAKQDWFWLLHPVRAWKHHKAVRVALAKLGG
jgi:hypothetical protein